MTIDELLDRLGYAGSENYLRQDAGKFDAVVDYGHLFRKAAKQPVNLKGVYALSPGRGAAIPVVYVCQVDSEQQAKEAHQRVWDQDTVPFLIVNSPERARVYPGFCYDDRRSTKSLMEIKTAFANGDIETLAADDIDTGMIWRRWGRYLKPEHRIDRRLLDNLKTLDKWLQSKSEQGGGLSPKESHALIGKYVYLHYLSDRKILSPRKLESWKIPREAVFGRDANRDGLKKVQDELDDWLNGEVFPIKFSAGNGNWDRCISRVAATFAGAAPIGDDKWQLHLDFQAYDFSYIPIEVLSNIYEQFLHAPSTDGSSKGKDAGAYYTPIPVVNFMLSELEERLPLERGMRVFDPACGSGAFLVQAFRRLIEREYPPAKVKHYSPDKLRKLVEEHFFGLDTNPDACNVARLSLILTLLDYVDPPDLEDARRKPKLLPDLGRNIVEGDFFDDDHAWRQLFRDKRAAWVVGNPPWKKLKEGRKHKVPEGFKRVLNWIKTEEQKKKQPRSVGNCEAARAFAWRAAEYVSDTGELAMFLPAMTLFEDAAADFRRRFFEDMDVHTVANFSNLRHVISGGRFTAPAAAVFYRPRRQDKEHIGDEYIRTYSPLLANQEVTSSGRNGKRNESWNLVVNASEVRDIPLTAVSGGDSLPWKTAAWGSELDLKFIRSIRSRFQTTLGKMEDDGVLVLSEGLQLRSEDGPEETIPAELPPNAKQVDMDKLEERWAFFALPSGALTDVPEDKTGIRKRSGKRPRLVCEHPHILVSEGRTFAVYSDEFFVIPHPQIGIVSKTKNKELLKAIALFLNSDFLYYYEFLTSTKLGVERDVSTLDALRSVPTPLGEMGNSELKHWAKFYDELAEATKESWRQKQAGKLPFSDDNSPQDTPKGPVVSDKLMKKLNDLVNNALGLRPWEKSLIHDLVHVRLALNDGGLGAKAVDPPGKSEIEAYAKGLQEMLNAFIRGEIPGGHDVEILYELSDDRGGVGLVRVRRDKQATGEGRLAVTRCEAAKAAALKHWSNAYRQSANQWVYFDRDHYIYAGRDTYLLKPLQKLHWTKTQAMIDAGEMIAGSIRRGASS